METQNIVMRLVYTDKPSAAVMTILKTILCVVAAALSLLRYILVRNSQNSNNKITWALCPLGDSRTFDYCGHGSFALGVYGRRAFGGKPDD